MGEEEQTVPESSELPPVEAPVPKEVAEAEVAEKPTFEKVVEEAMLAAEHQKEESTAEVAETVEEKTVETTEAEDKTVVETVEEGKAEEVVAGDESNPPPAGEPVVEETYHVKDLKEWERKALAELKAKIEEAIKANAFLLPPKPEAPKEVEVEKKEEEVEAGKEGEVDVKEEEAPKDEEAPVPISEETAASSTEPPAEEPVVVEAPPAEEGAVKEVTLPVSEEPSVVEVVDEAVKEEDAPPPPSEPVEGEAPATEEAADKPAAEEVEVEKTSRDVVIEEDDSPSLEDLALWGVPLLHSKGDERTDVILLKFLRARDFKVNDAYSMLKETVLWRKEFNADSLIDEQIDSTDYDSVAYMHGCDKEGHPVCYNHYGIFQDKELYQKTFGDEAQLNNFLRWRIQVLEKGIQKLDFSAGGVHSMVQITDLKDSPGFVKRRNITKKAFTVLQDNYPELVAKQIFINVPWYFGALYSLHGKIVTPRSKSKVVVARPGKVTETLFKYISPEHVPVQYGGLSRPNDTEFEGVAAVKEMIVKPGEKQTIELPVEESGSRVVWDVGVVGWEVVYGEEFVPSAEGSYTVIIQKSKKVAASEEPTRNSFKTYEPGKVVLTIDNTASRKKKLVIYRYTVKEAIAPASTPVE